MPDTSTGPADRRRHSRHEGSGLMANINGKLVDIIDLGFGGVRLMRDFSWDQPLLDFQIIRRTNRKLHLNEAVRVTGRVIGATDTQVRIEFDRVAYALAKLIVRTTSSHLGVTPFLVK